ncbi:MAG TPA: hypothetical protein VE090_04580 [Methylomirabilota bacterium]|nr:hypothetical protein [Methylomirabilota bacterium]
MRIKRAPKNIDARYAEIGSAVNAAMQTHPNQTIREAWANQLLYGTTKLAVGRGVAMAFALEPTELQTVLKKHIENTPLPEDKRRPFALERLIEIDALTETIPTTSNQLRTRRATLARKLAEFELACNPYVPNIETTDFGERLTFVGKLTEVAVNALHKAAEKQNPTV